VTSLHDIESVQGFVRATVHSWRTGSDVRLAPGEYAELVCEGIVALYELAARYEHHRPGYEHPGSFAGFAAQLLPRRLTNAWHRMHPEHHRATRPDGTREWRYAPPTLSLDDLAERRPWALASARPIVAPPTLRRPPAGQLVLDLAAAA
jgi:hypothetical protein